MKKYLLAISGLVAFVFMSSSAYAAKAEFEWVAPEDFTDVRPATESRKKYRNRVMMQLEKHVNKLAAELPESQTIKLRFTDIDLAGDVKYMVGPNNSTIRVIENIYSPRLKFDYEVIGADKTVIISGSENIRDMSFMDNIRSRHSSESFIYEKNILTEWFEETLTK